MIDFDSIPWLWFNRETKVPLALIETALDVGQGIDRPFKPATALVELARICTRPIPVAVVLYTLDDKPNPADKSGKILDIKSFRMSMQYPTRQPFIKKDPWVLAEWEIELRGEAASHISGSVLV